MKPKPITLYFLIPVLSFGIVALFLSAEHAFSLVTNNNIQAICSALLIETGLIADAFTIFSKGTWKKKTPAGIGIVISLLVSGTYNYISAEKIGLSNGISNQWQLITLAIGTLSATLFLALQTSAELSKYQDALTTWMQEQQEQAASQLQAEQARLAVKQQERQEQEKRLAEISASALAEVERVKAQNAIDLQRLAYEQQARKERLARRRENRKTTATPKQEPVFVLETGLPAKDKLIEFYRHNPTASQSEAGREIGVSHTRVGQLLKVLEEEGKINKNGKVVVLS